MIPRISNKVQSYLDMRADQPQKTEKWELETLTYTPSDFLNHQYPLKTQWDGSILGFNEYKFQMEDSTSTASWAWDHEWSWYSSDVPEFRGSQLIIPGGGSIEWIYCVYCVQRHLRVLVQFLGEETPGGLCYYMYECLHIWVWFLFNHG